jgi:hypothetical protein
MFVVPDPRSRRHEWQRVLELLAARRREQARQEHRIEDDAFDPAAIAARGQR